jgi:ATP/ADP translocase
MDAVPARIPLEGFLNIFTEVRRGEAASALLLALNIFLILTAYYVLKPVREALILAGGGAEIKSYAAAGQALLLLAAVPLYGWLASRVPRQVLINGVERRERKHVTGVSARGEATEEEPLKEGGAPALVFRSRYLPLIALGGYLIAAFYPILTMVRWAKTAENATDYSLQNTVRQVLFLPTTREQKYRAKQAIDTFFVRAGDVLSAVLVFAGTTWLAITTKGFALFNVGLVIAWLILAILIGRHYRRLTAASSPGQTG